jgi:hypothetical protein
VRWHRRRRRHRRRSRSGAKRSRRCCLFQAFAGELVDPAQQLSPRRQLGQQRRAGLPPLAAQIALPGAVLMPLARCLDLLNSSPQTRLACCSGDAVGVKRGKGQLERKQLEPSWTGTGEQAKAPTLRGASAAAGLATQTAGALVASNVTASRRKSSAAPCRARHPATNARLRQWREARDQSRACFRQNERINRSGRSPNRVAVEITPSSQGHWSGAPTSSTACPTPLESTGDSFEHT